MNTGTFEIEGLAELTHQLKAMMTEDPTFRQRINGVIRKVLKDARTEISRSASSVLDNDPRHAYKAVRSAVYRRILGGQVNILQKRKAGASTGYRKPLKGLPPRGGNRWGRSQRTIALEGYEGTDRGFILRFVNAGNQSDRSIHSYTDSEGTSHSLRGAVKGGNRGRIASRNWFGPASQRALENAAEQLQVLIDKIIAQEFV